METEWETRFRTHPLWTAVDQLGNELAFPAPNTVEGHDMVSRLLWLEHVLLEHRENADVRGYTPTMLSNAQRALEGNVLPALAQYSLVAADVLYLRTAAEHVDTVLDQMGAWPPLTSKGAASAAGKAAKRFEQASQSALDELELRIGELRADLDALKSDAATTRAAAADQLTRFDAHATAQLDELRKSFIYGVAEVKHDVEKHREDARGSLEHLQTMEAEGRNLVHAVAAKVVAANYRKDAINKAVAGWVWDCLGLAVGGTSVILLLVHLFDGKAGDATTPVAITRLAVSIAGVGLAYLCFRRGTLNHQESRRSKRADIRLSTVQPFIANQAPEFRSAVIEGMADRIYLQGLLDEGGDHEPDLIGGLVERVLTRGNGDASAEETDEPK